ncbi:HNH endonuclease [Clostridium senegalense]|uniref:HNH endonuclease n=1 Tax=Clostridium senegalense TaxID=1465809 RepID=UPI000288E336|nr:HNH endonuclease [Clostridium senegalense]
MPKKICYARGCNELISMKQTYCDKHKKIHEEEKRLSNYIYDLTIRDKNSTSFYHSDEWLLTRADIKAKDKGLCVLCLSNKAITFMELVHHITELKENWELRCEPRNLISLCNSCHNEVHAEYKRSNKHKEDMQHKLKSLIKDR